MYQNQSAFKTFYLFQKRDEKRKKKTTIYWNGTKIRKGRVNNYKKDIKKKNYKASVETLGIRGEQLEPRCNDEADNLREDSVLKGERASLA